MKLNNKIKESKVISIIKLRVVNRFKLLDSRHELVAALFHILLLFTLNGFLLCHNPTACELLLQNAFPVYSLRI